MIIGPITVAFKIANIRNTRIYFGIFGLYSVHLKSKMSKMRDGGGRRRRRIVIWSESLLGIPRYTRDYT